MGKFTFLKQSEDSNLNYNGATSQLLIDLYNNQIEINSWIDSKMIHFDEYQNKDSLNFEFKDINGIEYHCSIYDDRSFELLQVFKYDDGSFEYINLFEIRTEITSDYRYVLDYLNSLPNTILEYFNNANSNNGNI